MLKNKNLLSLIFIIGLFSGLQAQQMALPEVEPSRFDFGKMWTFEHAPYDYFEETYDFRPSQEWVDHARLSAVRFASWCSGSFISPDGLILTNHHCSRGVVGGLMQEGENFDEQGFYAATQEEERRAEGLFVKQLVQIADVTDFVKGYTDKAESDQELSQLQDSALNLIIAQYKEKNDWEGLEIEPVTYYSGGKYSLYGYKRFDDIRLVLIPELQLGYFGGDPDNFTYPRYSLDFTIWRAYENGEPANTETHYFPFNAEGADEGDPVFVIGNPGSTERYRTVSQLEYDRDYRYNILHEWLNNRMQIMKEQYEKEPSHDLQESIFGLSNSIKAYGGILKGLHDPYLMGKKQAMEDKIKAESKALAEGNDYWAQLAGEYSRMVPYVSEGRVFAPTPLNGQAVISAHLFERYRQAVEGGAPEEEELDGMKQQLMESASKLDEPFEKRYLTMVFQEMKKFAQNDDKYVSELLNGRSPEEAAMELFDKTKFNEPDRLEKLLNSKLKKLNKSKDPIAKMGRIIADEFSTANQNLRSGSDTRRALEAKISNEVYNIYGLSIPPDATFTLRLADGVVKRYDYNGTTAPYKTTYFGMYNRHYANNGEFPWSLPQRWLNPSSGLLRSPLNFISTSDSVGGNSGSPVINKEGEIVGLLFDGNIESLPGNFIYEPTVNRSVNVHTGGIAAALKYIFNADRLLKELGVE